ncbi:hypothetical protein VKI21_15705 [Cyanobacterium aponinum UTEX 3222]|uniref:hypothetical protein n=1 Tax=Cyanobacterium aponinum TaxID=379064 RepID=UPI002B4BDC07|nr:hypothetical protein [Cyanobacterium aponinum]WRL38041.1 hypothetical protein VKI22_15675 [Cyanobacterium aponinum UTEX 3221]WRL41476.1 hypothetical protein VKI21_15705 [Cyanobacterium aponinum UTEX 3222]
MQKLKTGFLVYMLFFLFSCVTFPWFPGGGYWTIIHIITIKDNLQIVFNPNDYLLYKNRGVLRREWGYLSGAKSDFTEAIEILRKKQQFNNSLASAYDSRASVLERLGDQQVSLNNLDQAKKLYQLSINDSYQAVTIFRSVGNISASNSVQFYVKYVEQKLSKISNE